MLRNETEIGICLCEKFCQFIHAFHLFMWHIHSCVVFTHFFYLFRHRNHSHVALYLCVVFTHLFYIFIHRNHSRVAVIHASYSFVLCTHLCVALIRLSPLFMRYFLSLISHISHAAWSLLDLIFSLIYTKSQILQPEYSAMINTSASEDIYKTYRRLTQLL